MTIALAVSLCVLAALLHLVLLHRRRRVALGCVALQQLLRQQAVLRHQHLTRRAEDAVLLSPRPGRMRQVVAEMTPQPALLAETIPTQRKAEPGRKRVVVDESGSSGSGRLGSTTDNLLVAGAVGAAGIADWWQMDDGVLQAVEALTHQEIDSVVDLWNVVQDRDWSLGDSLFTSLRGHVGEQQAAEHLSEAGLQVDFPAASNQAGWDLDVEGHLVNVKVTADAQGTLSEHFDKYPDIPALINADAANIPADAIFFDSADGLDPALLVGDNITLVDEALSLHDAADAVHDAFGAEELTEDLVPGVGVLVTVVRSGMREGKLVAAGDTDRSRALKNVAVDTTMRGGGALAGGAAGAQAGATIDMMTGGLTMGLGTVIGGIVGAVSGAMAGSAVASDVRLTPLRQAQAVTQEALEAYGERVVEQHEALVVVVDQAQAEAQAAIAARAERAKEQLESQLAQSRAAIEASAAFDADAVLAAAMADLEQRCDALDATVVRYDPEVPGPYLRAALHRRRSRLERAARREVVAAAPGGAGCEAFWDIVAASVNGDQALRHYVATRLTVQRAERVRSIEHAAVQSLALRDARSAALIEVHATGLEAQRAGELALRPHAKRLQQGHELYRKEQRAAGLIND